MRLNGPRIGEFQTPQCALAAVGAQTRAGEQRGHYQEKGGERKARTGEMPDSGVGKRLMDDWANRADGQPFLVGGQLCSCFSCLLVASVIPTPFPAFHTR